MFPGSGCMRFKFQVPQREILSPKEGSEEALTTAKHLGCGMGSEDVPTHSLHVSIFRGAPTSRAFLSFPLTSLLGP